MQIKHSTSKKVVLAVSLLLLLAAAVGGTSAFLLTKSGTLTNTFVGSKVTTLVQEDFDGTTKKNVKVQNTGTTSAYIRAAVVITWKNAAGETYGKEPVQGKDYSIAYNTDNGWLRARDGFYYWTRPVAQGAFTENLITSCMPTPGASTAVPSGYFLSVEIIASGIQSNPSHVAASVWASGINAVNGGILTVDPYTEG